MKSVLIVDDDDAVRAALTRVLARAGYEVRAAPGGEEALLELRERSVDVVVTDIVMPRMNGVEMIKAIAKEYPQIRVVAISGGGNFGATEYRPEAITTTAYLTAAREVGAHVVLTKPFEMKDLIAAIEQAAEAPG